jgi:hypothetical protein
VKYSDTITHNHTKEKRIHTKIKEEEDEGDRGG